MEKLDQDDIAVPGAVHPGNPSLEQQGQQITEPILQFFTYQHLPQLLAAVSAPFADLAVQLVQTLPRNAERTVALRKLLEAKDAAVRARLAK